jgi:hypothetical protein
MEALCGYFPVGRTEIIGRFKGFRGIERDAHLCRRVLDMVRRRPCTVEEMAASLGVPLGELERTLSDLIKEKEITLHVFGGLEYVCTGDLGGER